MPLAFMKVEAREETGHHSSLLCKPSTYKSVLRFDYCCPGMLSSDIFYSIVGSAPFKNNDLMKTIHILMLFELSSFFFFKKKGKSQTLSSIVKSVDNVYFIHF